MSTAIRFLFSTFRCSPTDSEFVGERGTFKLPASLRFKESLGKDILILDLETRPLQSDTEWRKERFDWRKLDYLSSGIFSHYTYAMIHGYSYQFVQAPAFSDRHNTWIKPSAFAQVLQKSPHYKFIVFLDADATFHHMQLPIEWLLNYWQIEERHSITLALDPWEKERPHQNADRFDRALGNTGFMIIQNNNMTMEILKAWHECPDNVRYAGCSRWKNPMFHEQSAFGEFIRYDYPTFIKELECRDANGSPGVEVSQCKGEFVRHFWLDKGRVKSEFAENVMGALTRDVQREFSLNRGGFVGRLEENRIP